MTKTIRYHKCPLCGDENIGKVLNVKDHSISGEAFDLLKCGNCGFVFTDGIPSEDSVGKYYESEDYISHSNTKKGIVNTLYHKVRDIMLSRKHKLIQSLTKGKHILDVGCGTGYFLDYLKKRNYETLGIEVDETARNFGKENFSLKIHPPSKLLDGEIKQSFDAITLWHVLEHLYDPDKYFKAFSNNLQKDGFLIIAVPNHTSFDAKHYQAFWAGYDVPRHIWHFSPETMERMANKNGFVIIKMQRLPFDPFYNALLSEKYKKNGLFLFSGFIIGAIALMKSIINIRKSSSLIYIMQKSS